MSRWEPEDIRESTSPLEGFGIISKQEWDDAQAEITRLKEQLARTERLVEQMGIAKMFVEDGCIHFRHHGYQFQWGHSGSKPDLYAHLDGKVGG